MRSIEVQRKDKVARAKRKSYLYVAITCQLLLLLLVSGCGNKFWDPAQVGRFRPVPSVNVILDSLCVAEETNAGWMEGEEPRPADSVVMETDYTFKSGDIVRVSIFELLQQGVAAINDYVVTETGKISIPDVGVVEIAGLTETQLEEEIRQILSPSILKDPSVTVSLMVSQQRTFSILGEGIPGPGRYGIPRYDYRLTDALAQAGGQRQFNVSYIYVSRVITDMGTSSDLFDSNIGIEILEPTIPTEEVGMPDESDERILEVMTPHVRGRQRQRSNVVIASTEMGTISEYGARRRSTGYASADNRGGLLSGNTNVREDVGNTMIGGTEINGQPVTSLVSEVEPTGGAEAPGAGSLWEEPAGDEQVSVSDILKTLAARSETRKTEAATVNGSQTIAVPTRTNVSAVEVAKPRGGTVLNNEPDRGASGEITSVDSILKSLADRPRSVRPEGSAATTGTVNIPEPEKAASDDTSSIDSILKSLADRPGSVRPQDRTATTGTANMLEPEITVGPGTVEKPEGLDSILQSLDARSRQEEKPDQGEWQNVLESFAEPESVEPKAEDEMDLDELLKSFAEPDVGVAEPDAGVPDIGMQIDEQVGLDDVDLGIDRIDVPLLDVAEPGIGFQDVGMSLAPGVGATEAAGSPGRIEWVFQDGKWVPMQVGVPTVARPVISVDEGIDEPLGFDTDVPVAGMDWGTGARTRLIKIPTDKLMAGDSRYNIVIRPGDSIYVPVDVIGEFCVMGNVVRQGYIPITGRPLTLKMAVAAAGGLGPLAYPKRCEVTRRIGRKKEETIMVDLDKIASGEQPDFFIKPNDLINVGTHATSRWRAVLRNAFRASYGFGFVYDRNFALDNYYSSYGRTSRVDISEAVKIF